jgi:hypothetical protein
MLGIRDVEAGIGNVVLYSHGLAHLFFEVGWDRTLNHGITRNRGGRFETDTARLWAVQHIDFRYQTRSRLCIQSYCQ